MGPGCAAPHATKVTVFVLRCFPWCRCARAMLLERFVRAPSRATPIHTDLLLGGRNRCVRAPNDRNDARRRRRAPELSLLGDAGEGGLAADRRQRVAVEEGERVSLHLGRQVHHLVDALQRTLHHLALQPRQRLFAAELARPELRRAVRLGRALQLRRLRLRLAHHADRRRVGLRLRLGRLSARGRRLARRLRLGLAARRRLVRLDVGLDALDARVAVLVHQVDLALPLQVRQLRLRLRRVQRVRRDAGRDGAVEHLEVADAHVEHVDAVLAQEVLLQAPEEVALHAVEEGEVRREVVDGDVVGVLAERAGFESALLGRLRRLRRVALQLQLLLPRRRARLAPLLALHPALRDLRQRRRAHDGGDHRRRRLVDEVLDVAAAADAGDGQLRVLDVVEDARLHAHAHQLARLAHHHAVRVAVVLREQQALLLRRQELGEEVPRLVDEVAPRRQHLEHAVVVRDAHLAVVHRDDLARPERDLAVPDRHRALEHEHRRVDHVHPRPVEEHRRVVLPPEPDRPAAHVEARDRLVAERLLRRHVDEARQREGVALEPVLALRQDRRHLVLHHARVLALLDPDHVQHALVDVRRADVDEALELEEAGGRHVHALRVAADQHRLVVHARHGVLPHRDAQDRDRAVPEHVVVRHRDVVVGHPLRARAPQPVAAGADGGDGAVALREGDVPRRHEPPEVRARRRVVLALVDHRDGVADRLAVALEHDVAHVLHAALDALRQVLHAAELLLRRQRPDVVVVERRLGRRDGHGGRGGAVGACGVHLGAVVRVAVVGLARHSGGGGFGDGGGALAAVNEVVSRSGRLAGRRAARVETGF
mmetsp:Transcript_48796/g.150723  ORF Transcript_48796/g.150723 Transcript_48796/m.150723 type:complete len:826 (-) Transcript_48796:364-2841(-)